GPPRSLPLGTAAQLLDSCLLGDWWERSSGGPGEHASIGGKARAVAGAIPAQLHFVEPNDAPLMRAHGGHPVEHAVMVAACGDRAAGGCDDGPATGPEIRQLRSAQRAKPIIDISNTRHDSRPDRPEAAAPSGI